MSAVVSHQGGPLELHRSSVRPLKAGAIRERAIDAACLLLSLAGAGAIALAVLAAAELPSVGSSALRVTAEAPQVGGS